MGLYTVLFLVQTGCLLQGGSVNIVVEECKRLRGRPKRFVDVVKGDMEVAGSLENKESWK